MSTVPTTLMNVQTSKSFAFSFFFPFTPLLGWDPILRSLCSPDTESNMCNHHLHLPTLRIGLKLALIYSTYVIIFIFWKVQSSKDSNVSEVLYRCWTTYVLMAFGPTCSPNTLCRPLYTHIWWYMASSTFTTYFCKLLPLHHQKNKTIFIKNAGIARCAK